MSKYHHFMAVGLFAVLAGCQSSSGPASVSAAAPSATAAPAETETAEAQRTAPAATETAFAATARTTTSSGQCSMEIAGGPPPKPAKGADFAKNAVGNNIKRNVARNAITQVGGRLGGGLGAAVASGVARSQIRTEQDMKGKWTITDGSQTCGCQLEISSGVNMKMQSSNKGRLKANGCSSMVANAARWTLGHSFTGYDAAFQLLAGDNRTVLANMKRDGINYFSGTMTDGTPVTMWRRGG